MALPLANTFEGGSDGTTLTQGVGGNTGGASGNYFDGVSLPTGGTVAFESDAAALAEGLLGLKTVQGSTPANAGVRWTSASVGSPTEMWGRFYYRNPVGGVQGPRMLRLYNSGATVLQAALQLNSTGAVQIIASGNGNSSDGPLSADVLYRCEWHWVAGTTFEALLYLGHSTTLLTSVNNTDAPLPVTVGSSAVEVWYGQTNATAAGYVFYMDDLQVNAIGYPGPSSIFPRAISLLL